MNGSTIVRLGRLLHRVELCRFELTADLVPSGDGTPTSATAYKLWTNADDTALVLDETVEITVRDTTGLLRGEAATETVAGSRGIAWKPTDHAQWEILWLEPMAAMICGALGGALGTTDATQTISSPVAMDGGRVPAGTITGYNVYTVKGFEGPSGGRCVAAWNAATGHYEFIDVECP